MYSLFRSRIFHAILIGFAVVAAVWFTIAALYVPDFPIQSKERRAVGRIVGRRQFNFIEWEVKAVWEKVQASVSRSEKLLGQDEQKEVVLAYLAITGEARRLDRELENIYATSDNPEQDSELLSAELAQVRADSTEIRPIAESILQNQVADILKSEDMQLLGGAWPPVQAQMTPLPMILIVSPRDRIEQQIQVPLKNEITIPERDLLEKEIFSELGMSALVVPIGGLGTYPAMISERDNVNSLVRTIAHEWAHHWLSLYPLGRNYATIPTLRTINETAATIVGTEIGDQLVEQFYPEFVPVETPRREEDTTTASEPPAFDFRAEMQDTRIEVDERLARGEIDSAENYMETRRQLFVENGYLIRKINQAYFAFYGAYAASGGATGSDPVGPTVVAVREQSPTLRAFLKSIAPVVSFEALEALVED
ncbi:MAG: hypothetical protein ACPG8W_15710 [Candidatus Promineifilaceae bacterium]